MNEDAPLLDYNQQGWTQFKADLMRVVRESHPANKWESPEYPGYTPRYLKKSGAFERNRKFKMSQEVLFDEYLRHCKPDRMTVRPYGKTGLLIETLKAEERDPCERNKKLKEVQRRCEREKEFIDKLGKNWLDKEEQREEREYVGGKVTNTMRSRLQKQDIKMNPPDDLFLYVDLDKGIVTTWTGEKVGDVLHRGAPYRSNWGDERIYITTNIFGLKYTGTYYKGSGDYARLKRQKCHNIALHLLPACKDGFYRDWKHDGICVAVAREEFR